MLSATFPDQFHGLTYAFNSEAVNFQHAKDFFTQTPYPTGDRLHINPSVSLPILKSYGFLTPSLALDTTAYSVDNNAIVDTRYSPALLTVNSNPQLNTTRLLPILSIDSGLYFSRDIQLWKKHYSQTLEPRLFYLWVPFVNQNDIPIFDTTQPPFSFNTLFRMNRFMGYDRVGDANQIALGLTSRIVDNFNGQEKIKLNIGAIYYFHTHQVCLYPDCSDDLNIQDKISPIAAELSYYLNQHWRLTGKAALNVTQTKIDNDSLNLTYLLDPKRTISVGYNYIRNGDILNTNNINNSENNLHRINIALSWPITHNWSAIADWNYNISHGHSQESVYGLEYNSCCWAIRLVTSKLLASEDNAGNITFHSSYYVQFLLKGLGSFGENSGSQLIKSNIPSYKDIFKN